MQYCAPVFSLSTIWTAKYIKHAGIIKYINMDPGFHRCLNQSAYIQTDITHSLCRGSLIVLVPLYFAVNLQLIMSLTCCEKTHVTVLWERFSTLARALKGLSLGTHGQQHTGLSQPYRGLLGNTLSSMCVLLITIFQKEMHTRRDLKCACAKTGFSALQTLSIKHDCYYNTWPLLFCSLSVYEW